MSKLKCSLVEISLQCLIWDHTNSLTQPSFIYSFSQSVPALCQVLAWTGETQDPDITRQNLCWGRWAHCHKGQTHAHARAREFAGIDAHKGLKTSLKWLMTSRRTGLSSVTRKHETEKAIQKMQQIFSETETSSINLVSVYSRRVWDPPLCWRGSWVRSQKSVLSFSPAWERLWGWEASGKQPEAEAD